MSTPAVNRDRSGNTSGNSAPARSDAVTRSARARSDVAARSGTARSGAARSAAVPADASRSELALLEASRPVVESLGIGVAVLDRGLRVSRCSPLLLRLAGRPVREVGGRPLAELLPAAADRAVRDALLGVLDGRRHRAECRVALPASVGGTATLTAVALSDGRAVLAVRPEPWTAPPAAAGAARPEPDGSDLLEDTVLRILTGIAAGASTRELARECYLSEQGVAYHVGRLMQRFGATNRPSLVARAYAAGLLDPATWPPEPTGGTGAEPVT